MFEEWIQKFNIILLLSFVASFSSTFWDKDYSMATSAGALTVPNDEFWMNT